jgi:hypothetical protein
LVDRELEVGAEEGSIHVLFVGVDDRIRIVRTNGSSLAAAIE